MKSLLKKPWFIGTLILGTMLIVFLLNLSVMSLKLKSPNDDDSIFSLARNISDGLYINIYSYVLRIVFLVAIVPMLLSIFSFFRKSNWGFITAVLYFLAFETSLIVFQVLYNGLTLFSVILIIINIVLIVGAFILLIFRHKMLYLAGEFEMDEQNIKLSSTKIPLFVLVVDIVSIVVFLTTFFIPAYVLNETGSIYYATLINVLVLGDTTLETLIYFLVNFMIFLALFLYFAHAMSYYFFDKEKFILKSSTLINFSFIATIIFFLSGLTAYIYYTLQETVAQTYAFIPMLLMCLVIFAFAIFKGKYRAFSQVLMEESKARYAKIEPLLYVILLTALSVSILLFKIIKIKITYNATSYDVEMTGLNILRDYAVLDPGYRLVAFLLVIMLISVGLSLVISLSSYLSKHKQFSSIVKFATIVNVFFIFIIAISGYYFQIAKEINQSILLDVFSLYGISLPSLLDYDYTISTDAIYALVAAVAVLIMMFVRKAFDRDLLSEIEASVLPIEQPSDSDTQKSLSTIDEEVFQTFDPCPSLTDLDAKAESFKEDLERRKSYKVSETSLNDLILFVVDYARNSRLHLSYTPEDIATFVAGLGASRLSILQGMSGTGKTSLPKIFSEAIVGNCEIIEVESSWKDKNELLGYYNEFSMKYTPKKFTLALYKAALNPEIFTFILLDEMNLSRIEYYFSDFLSLMENEENQREIKLINIRLSRKDGDEEIDYLALNQGNTLKVPPNVWFIGTANRDESTFVISDKVYDRAHTMNFMKRAPKVRNFTSPISQKYYDHQTMSKLFREAKQKGSFDAEGSETIKKVEQLLAPYNISFGNRILNQIEDFVNIYKACFPNDNVENEAIEKILLSKVVAKLEVKTIDDKDKLVLEFEKLNLNECADFIKRLDNE
jgi:hypothetical protein